MIAGLVSMTGDWLLAVGLSYAVYDLTGSTMASAGVFLTSLRPQVVAGLVAGVLVDRWDRRRTMLAPTSCGRRAAAAPAVDCAGSIWVVYPVLVFQAVVETFFAPAEQAMLPGLSTSPSPPSWSPRTPSTARPTTSPG